MKKRVLLTLMMLFLTSSAMAEISLSEPLDIYNIGDRLYVTADGLKGSNFGNLNINLICGNRTTSLVKIPARAFSSEEEQSYSIPYKVLDKTDLEIENITDILGLCQVVATLGSGVASTKTFTISNEVNVIATSDKAIYNPGEGILLNIDARLASGVPLNGFVVGLNASEFNKAISEGSVSHTFSVPETTEAGNYNIVIHAYDMGVDGIMNEGETVVSFEIRQVASSMVLSLSEEEVIPGESLGVGIELWDQSGKEMAGSASVRLLSPEMTEFGVSVPAGDFASITLPTNASAGVWNVLAEYESLSEMREVVVAEIQKVEFEMNDTILIITNVGNVVYNKTIGILIGEERKILDLEIEVGEVRWFNMKAPTREEAYDIIVDDGQTKYSNSVMLTGKAVSVSDLENVGIFRGYSIVWVFLLLILGGVGIVMFFRSKKTKIIMNSKPSKLSALKKKIGSKIPSKLKSHASDTLNFTNKSPKVQGLDSKNYSSEDSSMMDLTKKNGGTAESTLVLKGEKQQSSIVSISVKNYSELSDHAKTSLKNIVGSSSGKGLVDWKEDYAFVVFSPIMTRTYNNEILAAKSGFEVLQKIEAHNKKFNGKIEFNIGVNSGELIASKEGANLKYTGVGNIVSLAKRISDSDSGKMLVSEGIRKKMLRDLKTEKAKAVGNHQTYAVSEIKNREANEAKLKDLLKRM